MKKRPHIKPVYKTVRIGTGRFLSSGAETHLDEKREIRKKLCHSKPKQYE